MEGIVTCWVKCNHSQLLHISSCSDSESVPCKIFAKRSLPTSCKYLLKVCLQHVPPCGVSKVDPLREIEPLDVVWHEGYWRSLSNRRLWTLKHCAEAMTGQPLFVRVRVRQKDAEFRAKCNSTNDGESVLIMNRARSPSPVATR